MADGSVKIDITADDSDVKQKLSGVKGEADTAAQGMDNLGDSAENAGKGFGAADVAIGTFVANGVSTLVSKVGEAIGQIAALADETREYRDDMAKLETAFTTAGHSTETANTAYSNFYNILGESDRSVEAANHLAELTKNEEEVAQWGTIAAGVTARFGDSLPIEGLTEAANETAKVGAVTGPLADALNWAGISEDEFNKKLAACNTEQERASLITSTLNTEYAAAAEEYNKLTANTQAARDATNNMEQAQAALGAAIEPVTTAWTNMKANALQWFVDEGLPALQTGWQWIKDNLPAIATIVGGLATAFLIYNSATIASTISTWAAQAAQVALNIAQNMSPLGWIVLAITAVVGAFMLLWNNCEGFRNFWIGLWENIKTVLAPVIEWIKQVFQQAWEKIKEVWDTVKPYFTMIWEKIKEIFSVVKEVLGNFFSAAWDAIKAVWEAVQPFFSALWEGIKNVFSVVKDVLGAYFQSAWDAIKLVWDAVTGFFRQIWETIKGIFAVVKDVLSGNFSDAWEKIKGIFAGWGDYFKGLFDKIVNTFTGIKDRFMEIGGNIVDGIKNGIKNAWNNLKKWFSGLFDDIIGIAKSILGINSPSRVFRDEVGKYIPQGLAVGWEDEMPNVEKQITRDISGLTARVHSTVSAENARMGQGVGVTDTGFADIAHAVGMQTAGINSLASEYRKGTNSQTTIPLILNGRELGRAIVDVLQAETTRTGISLA